MVRSILAQRHVTCRISVPIVQQLVEYRLFGVAFYPHIASYAQFNAHQMRFIAYGGVKGFSEL